MRYDSSCPVTFYTQNSYTHQWLQSHNYYRCGILPWYYSGNQAIASNLICLHAVPSANLMASLWLLWLLRNVVYYGMLLYAWSTITTMECIVEFSVRDKQRILLLWCISNDKKYVKLTNNFLQCSSCCQKPAAHTFFWGTCLLTVACVTIPRACRPMEVFRACASELAGRHACNRSEHMPAGPHACNRSGPMHPNLLALLLV